MGARTGAALAASMVLALQVAAPALAGHARAGQAAVVAHLRHEISWHRQAAWRWQDMTGHARTRTVYSERHTVGVAYLRWVKRLWVHRRLAARAAARALPAHYRLWACIHGGAYPGAPHEGWSRGGMHSGPLQMTRPWEGISYDWGALSYGAVYTIAEQRYRVHHYSRAWLYGQWPQTAPPCRGYA